MINSIKLINRILEQILKNNAKFELVEDLMNKVFFTVFKLIDKVSQKILIKFKNRFQK